MEKGNRLEEFIERYRFAIGGFLLLVISIGTAILLYRENYSKVSLEDRISRLESKVEEMGNNQETRDDNQTISNDKLPISNSIPNNQISNTQNGSDKQADKGSVAGVSTKETNKIPDQVRNDSVKSGKININTAGEKELDSLPGIGATYAKRILEYRQAHGGFKSIEEIKQVKGIGDKTFEKFKDKISI